jgi:hypothetical protein
MSVQPDPKGSAQPNQNFQLFPTSPSFQNLFIYLNYLIGSMNNEFETVMSKRTDAELLEVLNSPQGDYQPLALEAAKIELKKRNLSEEEIQSAENLIKHKQEIEYAQLNEPLSNIGKIYSFFYPRVFSTLLWRTYQTDRKYKERLRWHLYGICFYLAVFLYFFLHIIFQ